MNEMEEQGRKKWNVLDWRNSTSYPAPNDLNDTLWRWEFLRRRPDYRQDWERHYRETYEFNVACSKDPKFPDRYGKRVLSPDHPRFLAKMPYSLEKYHLQGLPNPSIREPLMLSFDSNYGRIYFGEGPEWLDGGDQISLRLPEWKIATVFDLKKPLGPQLKKVEKDLMEWQTYQMGRKLERRKSREQWPVYLQILDAVAVETSYAEFGVNILKIDDVEVAEARVHQLYQAACQLSHHFPD